MVGLDGPQEDKSLHAEIDQRLAAFEGGRRPGFDVTLGSETFAFDGFQVAGDELGIAVGGGGGHMMSVKENGKAWGLGFGDNTASPGRYQ